MLFHHRLGALLAVASSSGCMTYVAQIDRHVTRGDVSVHVQSARADVTGDLRMSVVLERVPPNVRLMNATVVYGSSLCEAGYHARALGRDPLRAVEHALSPRERLTFGFDHGAFEVLAYDDRSHLDLLLSTPLGSPRCIPLPLSKVDWEPVQRWTIGLGLSLEGFTNSLGAVAKIIAAPLELGVWVDDYHLELGAGIGGAGCPKDRCEPPSEEQLIKYNTIYPLYVGVRRSLVSWSTRLLGSAERFGFGGTLRYRAMKLEADTYQGHEQFWMHGPQLIPYFGHLGIVPEGLKKGRGASLLALEVPIGYAFAENGERAVSLGFNVAMFFTVL